MPIVRPVTPQIMVQRAAEVNRATNNDGSRAEVQNSQFSDSLQRAAAQEQRMVVNAHQAEKQQLDKDGRGGGAGGRGRDGRREKEEQTEEETPNKKAGIGKGMLDIKM